MQTLIEILKKTEKYFADKGIESPRLNAELLIAGTLGMKRLDLYLSYDRPLTEVELDQLRPLVKRRGNREPYQYIEGQTEFMDCLLKVDERCLIPRPETEELIEWIHDSYTYTPSRILDLGTGSGAIAIALSKIYSESTVVAVDRSEDSLALAKENARLNGVDNRVQFIQSDWFESLDGKFDLIVSNPPYLTQEEWSQAEPEVKDYEPISALTSEDNGFFDISKILREVHTFLKSDAWIYMETGIDHQDKLMSYSNKYLVDSECKVDLSGRQRFFRARRI